MVRRILAALLRQPTDREIKDVLSEDVADRVQFWLLVAISCYFVWAAPDIWSFTPDGGVYIGTAESLASSGGYRFNFHPNLLYYPATSTLLAIPIALWGTDFQVLHALFAGIAVSSLWLVRAYFPMRRYGTVGFLAPVILACASVFRDQTLYILSDGLFLAVSLAALLLWRRYAERPSAAALLVCAAFVAVAPLVRFQGLFLWGAFCIALLYVLVLRRSFEWKALISVLAVGLVTLLPFLLWTLRNYLLYTPDTFNMANAYFFGLHGLAISAADFSRPDWIHADWQYPFYSGLFSAREVFDSFMPAPIRQAVPIELAALAVGVIIAAGSVRWFVRASVMERIYVLVSLGFVLVTLLRATTVYTVPRYWLAVLPFLIVAAGFGFSVFVDTLGRTPALYRGAQVAAWLAVGVVLYAGVVNARVAVSEAHLVRVQAMNRTLDGITDYFAAHVPGEAVVATTDWGVLPRAVRRPSYPLLRGKPIAQSLERMLRYRVTHLVIMHTSHATETALTVVSEYPDLFAKLKEYGTEDSPGYGVIYRVRLDRLEALLRSGVRPAGAGADGVGSDGDRLGHGLN